MLKKYDAESPLGADDDDEDYEEHFLTGPVQN